MPYVDESLIEANLGWLYYKHYYEDSEITDTKHDENNQAKDTLANRNETILKRKYVSHKDLFALNLNQGFPCKVSYPGLLIGSGYTHEAVFGRKDDKDEAFKIGFFFDHISGMPYIPGHSLKGAIRASFPNHKHEKYRKEKSAMLIDLLTKLEVNPEMCFNAYLKQQNIAGVSYSDLCFAELLSEIVFEGNEPYRYENNAFVFQQIPLCRKDIFHDAFIVKGGKKDLFLANDYITAHSDPLKDPNPVKFLKILPEVIIHFQFDLKDNLIPKEAKEMLFKQLLLDFGIGAKTNVGYGQFEEGFMDGNIPNNQQKNAPEVEVSPLNLRTEPLDYSGKLKVGEMLEAKVINKDKHLVSVLIKGKIIELPMSGNCPDIDAIVHVKINTVNRNNEILQVGFKGEVKKSELEIKK